MDLTGKVIAVLPPREGTSARGPWKSQEYVIETHDQFPHEDNGRWFNNIRAWNIQRIDAAAAQAASPIPAAQPQAAPQAPTPFPPATESADSTDDLPF